MGRTPPAEALVDVLMEAQRRGLVGPGPVEEQRRHALGVAVAAGEQPSLAADLGSGGGLPGLVLALAWPATSWVLIDSRERSGAFLLEALERLDLASRVEVVVARAEEVGRDKRWRGRFPLVVARGFGPPALTAECAAPLLVVGGSLVVSEPPDSRGERWPAEGLARLGMGAPAMVAVTGAGYVRIEQEESCPMRYPRRVGVPAKRPLF